MSREIYVPPGGPPRVERPDPAIYAAMGAENIIAMLEDFYMLLGASAIAAMFPQGEDALREASRKSAAFFIGLLGGPPVYQQLYGNPMMRARHMPFPIDDTARRAWLRCFDQVLCRHADRVTIFRQNIWPVSAFLDRFSGWMVNRAPEE
ncbi:MAG: hypothetical protein R2854_18600 [Caldilineaceae bacterium]